MQTQQFRLIREYRGEASLVFAWGEIASCASQDEIASWAEDDYWTIATRYPWPSPDEFSYRVDRLKEGKWVFNCPVELTFEGTDEEAL